MNLPVWLTIIYQSAPPRMSSARMRTSKVACLTTTGERFERMMPEETAADIASRVNLLRHPL